MSGASLMLKRNAAKAYISRSLSLLSSLKSETSIPIVLVQKGAWVIIHDNRCLQVGRNQARILLKAPITNDARFIVQSFFKDASDVQFVDDGISIVLKASGK
jgi:hypothetical protein